jgi:hypothetical protein
VFLQTADHADNYDLNELWYEYEAKKTAQRAAEAESKQAQAAQPQAMDVEA